MSVIVEGTHSFQMGGMASLVEEAREFAWAENHIRKAPDVRWLIGNFVQTATQEVPTYNSNGQSFLYEDLQDSIGNIPNRPLNLNHAPNRRLGALTAAEFVWPNGETADAAGQPPIVEVLACYWAYYEPDLLPAIEMAYREGSLFLSMEAVPQSITCRGKGDFEGCGKEFAYDGRQSPTYCDHLNVVASRKVLHKPRFTASALIVPPVRPGWKNAEVKELSRLIEDNLAQAEVAYEQVADMTPHLGPRSWERIAAYLLAASE